MVNREPCEFCLVANLKREAWERPEKDWHVLILDHVAYLCPRRIRAEVLKTGPKLRDLYARVKLWTHIKFCTCGGARAYNNLGKKGAAGA